MSFSVFLSTLKCSKQKKKKKLKIVRTKISFFFFHSNHMCIVSVPKKDYATDTLLSPVGHPLVTKTVQCSEWTPEEDEYICTRNYLFCLCGLSEQLS